MSSSNLWTRPRWPVTFYQQIVRGNQTYDFLQSDSAASTGLSMDRPYDILSFKMRANLAIAPTAGDITITATLYKNYSTLIATCGYSQTDGAAVHWTAEGTISNTPVNKSDEIWVKIVQSHNASNVPTNSHLSVWWESEEVA